MYQLYSSFSTSCPGLRSTFSLEVPTSTNMLKVSTLRCAIFLCCSLRILKLLLKHVKESQKAIHYLFYWTLCIIKVSENRQLTLTLMMFINLQFLNIFTNNVGFYLIFSYRNLEKSNGVSRTITI